MPELLWRAYPALDYIFKLTSQPPSEGHGNWTTTYLAVGTFPVLPFIPTHSVKPVNGFCYQTHLHERRPHFVQCQPLLKAYVVVTPPGVSTTLAGVRFGNLWNFRGRRLKNSSR